MGEVFKGIKLGTCEDLMYVTREEVSKKAKEINCDGLKEYLTPGYSYRFPFADEVNTKWEDINKREPFKGLAFMVDPNRVGIPHKDFMQVHLNEKFYNLPYCIVSDTAKIHGVRAINGDYVEIKIVKESFNQLNPNGYTVFQCSNCEALFAIDRVEKRYIQKALKDYGYERESKLIKYKIVDADTM